MKITSVKSFQYPNYSNKKSEVSFGMNFASVVDLTKIKSQVKPATFQCIEKLRNVHIGWTIQSLFQDAGEGFGIKIINKEGKVIFQETDLSEKGLQSVAESFTKTV